MTTDPFLSDQEAYEILTQEVHVRATAYQVNSLFASALAHKNAADFEQELLALQKRCGSKEAFQYLQSLHSKIMADLYQKIAELDNGNH